MSRFHKDPLTLKGLSISEVLLLTSFRVTMLFMVHAVFSFTAERFCGKSTQGARRLLKVLPFSFHRNTKCDTFPVRASVVLNRENNTLPLRSIKGLPTYEVLSVFKRRCCKCKLFIVTTQRKWKRIFILQVSDEVEQSCQMCCVSNNLVKGKPRPKMLGLLSNLYTNVFLGLRLCQKLGGDFLGCCFPVKIHCQKAGLLLHPNIYCFILYWLFKYLCAFRSSNFISLTEKCCIWQWLWANNTQDVWTALCSVFLCPSNLDYVFVNLFDHSAHENYKLTSVSRS